MFKMIYGTIYDISKIRRVYVFNATVWVEWNYGGCCKLGKKHKNQREALRILADVQNYLYTKMEVYVK